MADDTYDLEIVQGEDFSRTFAYRFPDETYLDFSAISWQGQIRQRESSTSPLLLDLSPHLSLADSTHLQLNIPGAVTEPLNPKLFARAAWDLFLILTSESRVRLLQGAVTFDPQVTAVGIG